VFYSNAKGSKINPLIKNILNYLFGLVLILGIIACNQEKSQQELLARIEDHEIFLDDFRLFYEFDPNFGMDSTGMDALKDQLDTYIDRILATKKAEKENIWEDPVYVRAYNWEKHQAMLRQLYREMVEKSVKVSEEETRQEYIALNMEVNIRHLFSKNEASAEELYQQLQKGEGFENLALQVFQDTILSKNGGNLGWLKLSDFDEDLANAIKKLPVNHISGPVASKWGYHIIEVLDRRKNPIITEEDYFRQREKISKILKNRKSRKLASNFISNYIGELNPQLNKQPFRQLLYALVPLAEREKTEYTNKIALSDGLIKIAGQKLNDVLEQPLISSKDGSVSTKEYLDAMTKIPLGHRPEFSSARQFSNQIGIWIRDNLLLDEAFKLNLDENYQVVKEINEFKAEQSYYYYHNQIRENLEIPLAVNNYFKTATTEIYTKFCVIKILPSG
jgi:parvulin-like peptidyl-prolyl isomerase